MRPVDLPILINTQLLPRSSHFHSLALRSRGNNVRTTCLLAEGDMPVTFTWLRNGVDASQSKNVHIVSHSDFSVLSVNPVDGQSAGNYTCIAKNRAGFDSFTAYLDVEAPPSWLREPQDVGGTLGTKLAIECAASGSPAPIIRWFKLQDGGFPHSKKTPQPREANENGSMVIPHIETQDAGQYVCEADNGIAPTLRKTVTVKVTEVPEIRPFGFSKNIPVGGKALVTCWITSGVQPVTFSWLKDGQSLNTVQGTRLKTDPDYSVLLLEPVVPSHVGNYTCIAKNKYGFDSYTTVLEVECKYYFKDTLEFVLSARAYTSLTTQQLPLLGKKVSGDVSVILDGTLVIDCLASGFPQPTLTFHKIGDKQGHHDASKMHNERLTVHRNGTVIITQVSMDDAGTYACEAQNSVPPSVRHTVKVAVNAITEPPKLQPFSFPGSVKPGSRISAMCWTTLGSNQVTISWLKDGNDLSSAKNVFVETKRGLSTILIEPVEVSNAGNYTCIAKNRAGFDSYTAVLDVQAAPLWKKTPGDVRVNIGERAIFECLASGSPAPKIKWRKQSSAMNLISSSNGSLLIDDVSIDDAGQYVCEADNGIAPTASHSFTVTVNAPPRIKPFSFPKVASKGEKISIVCLVGEGTLPFSFSWSKDGKELQTTDNVHVKAETQYSVVFVNSVDERTTGNYTCIVKNIFGFDSYSAYLDVEAPPVLKKTTPDTNVVQGGSVTLSCLATGSPKPSVNWSRSSGTAGAVALAANPRIQSSPNGTLLFEGVAAEDAGKYTCTAQNAIGSVSHSLYLHVRAPPRIKPFSFLKVASKGEKVSITCLVSEGTPPFSFAWSKDGNELQTTGSVKVKPEPEYSVVFINSVDEKSAGNYTCIVKNIFGFDSYSAYLDVEAPPTIKPFSFAKVASKGEKVSILCFVSGGTPPFSFSWLKDGKEVQTSENVKVKTESDFSLTIISSIDEKSAGNYTCIVKNIFGFDTHSAYLDVEGAADEVTFSASDSRIRAFPNGTVVIDDVTAEDAGKYTCRAQNGIGSVSHSLYLHVRGMKLKHRERRSKSHFH
ncbi:hypothetical protein MRX96_050867 [Rhipicephalus microplus]